jgi:LysM repeat protein
MKWGRFGVLAALLVLAGCFRPAGDSIEPTSADVTNIPTVQSQDQPTATSGLPPVTLLSQDTPVATATQPLPVITEITLSPATDTFTPTVEEQNGSTTPTLQLITPGFSSLITPDTPTPLPMETLEAGSDLNMGATPEVGGFDASGNPEETLVSGADCTYTVESGDSLYRIAVLNDTTVDAMMDANPDLTGDAPVLQPGQVLKLPDCIPGESSPTPTPTEEEGGSGSQAEGTQQVYIVKSGDTMGAIATRFGVTVNALMAANNLDNPNVLSIGQSLIIPTKTP